MYCVNYLLCMLFASSVVVNSQLETQQCDKEQSPLELIEEYISNPYTDISYTYFLNTIINQFGEFTKIDSRLYREGITEDEVTCLSRFVSNARERTIYQIKNAIYCLSPDVQFELGVPIVNQNTMSQYECLENALNEAKIVLGTINRDADQHCSV